MRSKRLLLVVLCTTFLIGVWFAGGYSADVQTQSSAEAALPTLRINELMAENDSTLVNPDDAGEFDDWIELYNDGATPIELAGYYLTDDLADPLKHKITGTLVISPASYLLIFADGHPELGADHVDFKLSRKGEAIGLTASDGVTLIDSVTFMTQTADVSLGRNVVGEWVTYTVSTPGHSNEQMPPEITEVVRSPIQPTASDQVIISATIISGNSQPVTASVVYRVDGAAWFDTTMTSLGSDLYQGVIPIQNQDQLVEYYVHAQGADLLTITNPLSAPDSLYRYVVDYVAPKIRINELMADNDNGLEDPDELGSFPDWVELHNFGSDTIDLSGMQLTDELGNTGKYVFPEGISIAAGNYLILYADNDPEEGDLHLTFSLSKNGEQLALYDSLGRASNLIDQVEFGEQQTDVAYIWCGENDWRTGAGTPSAPNLCFNHVVYLPILTR